MLAGGGGSQGLTKEEGLERGAQRGVPSHAKAQRPEMAGQAAGTESGSAELGEGVEGPGVGQPGQSMRRALTDPEGSGKPLARFVHGLGLG